MSCRRTLELHPSFSSLAVWQFVSRLVFACVGRLADSEAMSTPQVRDSLKYTRICKYWSSNRCKLGKDCNFAHSEIELRNQPDLVATRLCFQFSSKGRCKKGDDCKFAHGKAELRSVPKSEKREDKLEPMKIKVGSCQNALRIWVCVAEG